MRELALRIGIWIVTCIVFMTVVLIQKRKIAELQSKIVITKADTLWLEPDSVIEWTDTVYIAIPPTTELAETTLIVKADTIIKEVIHTGIAVFDTCLYPEKDKRVNLKLRFHYPQPVRLELLAAYDFVERQKNWQFGLFAGGGVAEDKLKFVLGADVSYRHMGLWIAGGNNLVMSGVRLNF